VCPPFPKNMRDFQRQFATEEGSELALPERLEILDWIGTGG
jgi:hypothetical protein